MQFADFLVSWALQALSRSLQKVSETQGGTDGAGSSQPYGPAGLRPSDEKSLTQTAQRILSLWQMAQWSVSKLEFERACADLKRIIELCDGDRLPERLAAERLLERAEPKAARLLGEIIAGLTPSDEDHLAVREELSVREELNELLQAESQRWRNSMLLRQIEEQSLIEHGMLRAFDKASSLTARLNDISSEKGQRASAKRLLRTGRWVHHTVNHLELLRPALSEMGKTRRWHLNRLAAKLDEQWALEKLARTTVVMALRPKASARLEKLISQERRRLEGQRQKLSLGAFAGGSAVYRSQVTEAVAQLGLEAITLLPIEGTGWSEKEIG